MKAIMTNEDYPSLSARGTLFTKGARHLSFSSQTHLGSLASGSVASALAAIGCQAMNTYLYTGLAIVLVVGLLILWAMRARQDEKIWFDGRAVAESVKTAAWRFMMKAPPFHANSGAEELFLAELKEIREARPNLWKHLAAAMNAGGSPITHFMKEKRSSSLKVRWSFYASARIHDQKAWYAEKAKSNVDSNANWFWAIAIPQVVIVVLAIVQALTGSFRINLIAVGTTSVAVMAAWSQVKHHDELAQSYALAAQELEEIETISDNQPSEDAFSQLVEQAENSISREHTMCAPHGKFAFQKRQALPRAGGQRHA